MHAVKPHSNGPAFVGTPSMTNANSLCPKPVFFSFLYWLRQNSVYNNLLVPSIGMR